MVTQVFATDKSVVNQNHFNFSNELTQPSDIAQDPTINLLQQEAPNDLVSEDKTNEDILAIQSGNFESLSPEAQEELAQIDVKAQYYYDYYKENGYYLEENSRSIMSASQGVSVLSGAGFYITSDGLAKLCATLGTIALAYSPLPVGDVISIVIGVTVLSATSGYYIYNLYNNSTTADKGKSNAVNAISTT